MEVLGTEMPIDSDLHTLIARDVDFCSLPVFHLNLCQNLTNLCVCMCVCVCVCVCAEHSF
jgi:hypothetical protein